MQLIILQGTLPAYCIPKVERLKTGEVLYERRYLSPRPPPKISLRHDHNWTRGNDQLGSTVEQQPVGKLVQQSSGEAPRVKLSKPTQCKPNPICDRSGKLEVTERVFVDKGKTSRSREIDVKRLHKELSSSDRTGKPVKLSEDIRVMHAHDGTGEPVKSSASTHTVKEQFVPAEHRDIASSNADNKFNRATDEENIDFNIPGVPNSTVKRSHGVNVHNLIERSRTTLSNKHFRVIFNNIEHSTLSAKNHKTWLKQLETLNYARYSMLSQKHTAKHASRIGTLASSTARAGTSYKMIRQKTRSTSSLFLISSLSRTFTSGRADHTVTGTGRKKVIKNTTLQINSKRSAGNEDIRTFTIDLFVTHGSEKPCWN